MPRPRSLPGLLAALPLAVAAGGPAFAETVTAPGCFGAVVIVCDPTVTLVAPAVAETYATTVPVCAGTCHDVPVTLVRSGPGTPGSICLTYENRDGAVVYRFCQPLAIPTVPDYPGIVIGFVEDFIDGRDLGTVVEEEVVDRVDDPCDPWDGVLRSTIVCRL